MNDEALNEMIYAYAAGCLDREELKLFLEGFKNRADINYQELADLQKAMSLLPLIIEREYPSPEVKAKLLSKINIANAEMNSVSNVDESEQKTEDDLFIGLDEEELILSGEYNKDQNSNNDKSQSLGTSAFIQEGSNEEGERKVRRAFLFSIMALLVSITLISGMYYFFSLRIQKESAQISELKGRVNTLSRTLDDLNKKQTVNSILSSKDAVVISLDATLKNPTGFGRLTWSVRNRQGVLQLFNMPPLKEGQVYQLWRMNGSRWISVGTFKSSGKAEQFIINGFPRGTVSGKYMLTVEKGESAKKPSDNIVLSTPVHESVPETGPSSSNTQSPAYKAVQGVKTSPASSKSGSVVSKPTRS